MMKYIKPEVKITAFTTEDILAVSNATAAGALQAAGVEGVTSNSSVAIDYSDLGVDSLLK